jgi:hypothetical protein
MTTENPLNETETRSETAATMVMSDPDRQGPGKLTEKYSMAAD